MAVGKIRTKTENKMTTQINLQRLLIPTEYHPRGRVQIDAKTGLVMGPRNGILYRQKKIGRDGREVERIVNGGHATNPGNLWRTALNGPARYIWKLMRDELAWRLRGQRLLAAPILTDEEYKDARLFVLWLLEKRKKGENVIPDDFLNKKYDLDKMETFRKIDGEYRTWADKLETMPDTLPAVTAVFELLPA